MPGSNDELASTPPGVDQASPRVPDQVKAREPDPVIAELRERMERLPPGHPSSPYKDDGSRKPPPPDLSVYELPIPGDPDYRPEPSGAAETDRPETAQIPEDVTPGTNPDEDPERTADRPQLERVRHEVQLHADAEYAEYVREVRGRLDQARALGLPTDEEYTRDAHGEVSQEEREASHDAPADDLSERASDELPVGDLNHRPDVPRAPEADHNHKSPAADRDSDRELPPADQEGLDGLDAQEQSERRLSQVTDRAIERCQTAEGRDTEGNYGEDGLTPAMRRIESQLEHGHLTDETEEHALKGYARFKEKLAERIERFPNANPDDLAAEIHDGVRYTFVLDFDHYTESVGLAQSKLAEAGYDHIETKPGWHGEEYKGVNSQWGDPNSGIRFEVQFHTSESWSAKQITHEAYEAIRSNKASVEEAESLRAYQREVSATVRIPPGALDIPAYRKGR